MLLVVPQFLVWTYSLTWLVQERDWSAASAGALVAGHPRARRPRPDRGRAALRRRRLAGAPAALGGARGRGDHGAARAGRAVGDRRGAARGGLDGHRGRQRTRLHQRGRARRAPTGRAARSAYRTPRSTSPPPQPRPSPASPSPSGGTPPPSASRRSSRWSPCPWFRARTRPRRSDARSTRDRVTPSACSLVAVLTRSEGPPCARLTTSRSRAGRRLAVAVGVSVAAVLAAVVVPPVRSRVSRRTHEGRRRLQEGLRRRRRRTCASAAQGPARSSSPTAPTSHPNGRREDGHNDNDPRTKNAVSRAAPVTDRETADPTTPAQARLAVGAAEPALPDRAASWPASRYDGQPREQSPPTATTCSTPATGCSRPRTDRWLRPPRPRSRRPRSPQRAPLLQADRSSAATCSTARHGTFLDGANADRRLRRGAGRHQRLGRRRCRARAWSG